jgi:hypothetical protein
MNIKLPRYRQALLATFCLGIVGLIAGYYQVSISFEPSTDESLASSTEVPVVSEKDVAVISSSPSIPINQGKLLTYKTDVGSSQVGIGTLRMSNQTNQAVRLALLSRGSEKKATLPAKEKANVPAHWDFAPQEGSERGLVLSLPQGSLKLGKGDILVAFAQDGSRRYWGPYVVGETPVPAWDSQRREWWLILNPEGTGKQ